MSATASYRDSSTPGPMPATEFLSAKLPWENLSQQTDRCRTVEIETVRSVFDRLARSLHSAARPHVLITGERGVGKTTLVKGFAHHATTGRYPFLANHQFLWIDCQNVGPEDSRACLETILAASVETEGPVVLCLDGFDALLVRDNGGSNKPLIRAVAARGDVTIIGILSKWACDDLISGDVAMLDLFSRIELAEPSEESTRKVTTFAADALHHRFGVTINGEIIDRCVTLASNYLLNERHPAKSIKLLTSICENLRFERDVLGHKRAEVEPADLFRAIAQRTGIPEATLTGNTGVADYQAALSASIVGQHRALAAVATDLQLIKAGLTEPNKPATVLLFAGMTGVGKTELAKRVAELYSGSGRLNTYTMGNFTEPHTVSGIIGVPPGYVGHDAGGRLINELNADPYSVFLLDEAEKAHPNVWKPFLNLFDEGWIVDQRGVKAYADRAIFILTTNAGDKHIAQMTCTGKLEDEIIERVKQTLSRIRQERSAQPVFTPQFLARMRRIVVFGTLDEAAMIDIARIQIARMQSLWMRKREKQVIVPEQLIRYLGEEAHRRNEKANGQAGGRIMRKLISDQIEIQIQSAATAQPREYADCQAIQLEFSTRHSTDAAAINVTFVPSTQIQKH